MGPGAHVVEIGCGPRGSQDASVYIARLEAGAEVIHPLGEARGAYVYLIDGAGWFDDEEVSTGDAAKVTGQPELVIRAWQTSELILGWCLDARNAMTETTGGDKEPAA